jgi:hypothetical protein
MNPLVYGRKEKTNNTKVIKVKCIAFLISLKDIGN